MSFLTKFIEFAGLTASAVQAGLRHSEEVRRKLAESLSNVDYQALINHLSLQKTDTSSDSLKNYLSLMKDWAEEYKKSQEAEKAGIFIDKLLDQIDAAALLEELESAKKLSHRVEIFSTGVAALVSYQSSQKLDQ